MQRSVFHMHVAMSMFMSIRFLCLYLCLCICVFAFESASKSAHKHSLETTVRIRNMQLFQAKPKYFPSSYGTHRPFSRESPGTDHWWPLAKCSSSRSRCSSRTSTSPHGILFSFRTPMSSVHRVVAAAAAQPISNSALAQLPQQSVNCCPKLLLQQRWRWRRRRLLLCPPVPIPHRMECTARSRFRPPPLRRSYPLTRGLALLHCCFIVVAMAIDEKTLSERKLSLKET